MPHRLHAAGRPAVADCGRPAVGLQAAVLLAVALLALAGGLTSTASAKVALRAVSPASVAAARSFGPEASAAAASNNPLTPIQVRAAYGLPSRGARGQTIAVIGVYDDPSVASDLQAYSHSNGLPACVGVPGCFIKLNEQGQPAPLPPVDPSGGQFITESAVGTQVARGICSSCRIMLVEAAAPDANDLASAFDAAARAGATVAVTAATPPQSSLDSGHLNDFSHPGMAAVAAAGDAQDGGEFGYGGGVVFPASLPQVLAVGGTDLAPRHNGSYGSEQVWAGTVSGCSLYEQAASWQQPFAARAGCQTRRLVADVAAMSVPGVLVHITGSGAPGGPWFAATGTSVSAPLIAGVIGLAGSLGSREAQVLYAHSRREPSALHDIVRGFNDPACPSLLCRAGRGYDAPTGVGTPQGLAAFLPSGGALVRRRPGVFAPLPRGGYGVDGRRRVRVTVRNTNSALVIGQVIIHRTVRVGGRNLVLRAAARLSLAPLGSETVTVGLPGVWRPYLTGHGGFNVRLDLRVHGPTGPTLTVSRDTSLRRR